MNAPASLDGSWQGEITVTASPAGVATGVLTQSGAHATGSIVFDAGTITGTFVVHGSIHGKGARLVGTKGDLRLRWRAHWNRTLNAWRGRVSVRGGTIPLQAVLVMQRQGGAGANCGALTYFTSDVMPTVFEPICAQCHSPSGTAQATTFRVATGDAAATMLSAAKHVDTTTPANSRILRKPRAELPHGGGQRVVLASTEDRVLTHWVELFTSPDCNSGPGGGGGGGGGGSGDLYTDNCASCHGTDARGVQGRPDIHCNRSIHDVVVAGRQSTPEDMPAFPNLSDVDITVIQTFLNGLCPTTSVTGAELFASNCASCHGSDAGGTTGKPSVRCATRIDDAVRTGRGSAMPSFSASAMSDVELGRVKTYLAQLCTQAGRSGADLYAGNCSTCHGANAGGGRNALGVRGPNIKCKGLNDYVEKVQNGDDDMPAFPALSTGDIGAMRSYVHASFCPGG